MSSYILIGIGVLLFFVPEPITSIIGTAAIVVGGLLLMAG